MIRLFLFLLAFGLWPLSGVAQNLSALARVDSDQSAITDGWWGTTNIDLHLSQAVPYRVYSLADPRRLVIDFQEVDWSGVSQDALLDSKRISDVRFGPFRPGWSRLIADLTEPMVLDKAGLDTDITTGTAHLRITLRTTDADTYAARSGAPSDLQWALPAPADLPARAPRTADDPLIVVIDPGHGGVDPGAERDGDVEKVLMLQFARELREVLVRSGGFEVVLTRDADVFVSLQERIAIAHRAGADVFLSLHADSLSEGQAHGATIYTLSDEASDKATEGLAQRHNRADVLAGVDLSGSDDEVTGILLELARQETKPRTKALARALADAMEKAGGPMNNRAIRHAGFSVLKAADIPSVLIELGFLSSNRDLDNLRDPEWRARMARGIRQGLQDWAVLDEAVRDLVRQ
ncbi:N-acetylmuramoyl-L-alanine amidase AmiC (plasmid) [Pseudoseohaeicola sp. NH-UV-7]|uniref:N-acetylmuramoyl-L-alanine amidase n=1 Tax=unclassified Sulfitobacter TaxID=196795 RepID=UPI000E0AE98A|nr:N-acetylmuramoyl-L-alanine amidase [Sulfitobacter sp. JL08]AXI56985.1 N-acetylmuramoyl-L-alanine amidase [Sulfitobacter sp. JL08]